MKLSKISISTAVLIAILLAAFVLRVWGASFGLPFVYHPDEGFEVNRALQLGTGEFDFNFFRMVKGGYFYLLFVEFGFLFVIMKVFGFVSSTTDFAMWYIRDPSIFYLVGRVTTGLIGTIAVYLLYRIGTRIHSSRVGLIAAALMASNVLQVVHSHYITVDIPLTCLCLAGLLFIVRIDQTGSRADYIGACLFAALATITKLPGVLLIIPLFAVHMKRSLQSDGQFLQTFFNKSIVIGGTVFITVFYEQPRRAASLWRLRQQCNRNGWWRRGWRFGSRC
ncbi:MAG: glycosyltransferase family 39 protein [Gammaproteobacteria bacterium]|nr:glycosyltransferase family 39 protein [Gammaproteobacteria bacterium]